ncbi:unnamed protein product, partial [Meganyctiphanes norvegica]
EVKGTNDGGEKQLLKVKSKISQQDYTITQLRMEISLLRKKSGTVGLPGINSIASHHSRVPHAAHLQSTKHLKDPHLRSSEKSHANYSKYQIQERCLSVGSGSVELNASGISSSRAMSCSSMRVSGPRRKLGIHSVTPGFTDDEDTSESSEYTDEK